jgi:hypothetical protein
MPSSSRGFTTVTSNDPDELGAIGPHKPAESRV